jgi:hypothetical protein
VGAASTIEVHAFANYKWTWTRRTLAAGPGLSPAKMILESVACVPGETECTAVGSHGLIVDSHNDTYKDWSASGGSGQSPDLMGISCPSGTTCVIVGTGGTILVGPSWLHTSSGTTQNLNAVTCFTHTSSTAISCVAVGTGGAIVTSPDILGKPWTSAAVNGLTSAVTKDLYAVACATGPDAPPCLAVGQGGTELVSQNGGATWTSQPGATAADLHAVASAGALNGVPLYLVAGSGGTFLICASTGKCAAPAKGGLTLPR